MQKLKRHLDRVVKEITPDHWQFILKGESI